MFSFSVNFHQRPQRPGRPPRGPPLFPPLAGAVCAGPGWPPLVLWLPRPPRCWPLGLLCPRRFAGSWPDSHRGGGTGFGVGGADLAAFPAGGGVTLTGITDSSLALLVADSCVSPPPVMCAISFVAATLVAFEVRWTPSPAQMLVPSTVASSCKGDSCGPKNSIMLGIFASEVRVPAAAASVRLFSDPEISLKKSGSWRFDTWFVSSQQATRTYLGSGTVSSVLAPPTLEIIFSTNFIVDLKFNIRSQATIHHFYLVKIWSIFKER